MLISLGCNCHPAYWMKLSKATVESFPFDWLLSKGHLGLNNVADVVENEFDGFIDDLKVNHRGHPVAKRYPNIELFHHHDLVSEDLELKKNEIDKINRRVERFKAQAKEVNDFLYCYPLNEQTSQPSIQWIDPRDRLYVYSYYRDQEVSKTWGNEPQFLKQLSMFAAGSTET